MSFHIVRAAWTGIVFNLENGTMEFPGGYISYNSFRDFFNPKMLLQDLYRFTIKFEDVRMISAGVHTLEVNGAFGAIRIPFASKQKLSEAYSFILQHNEMGIPMVRR